MQAHQTAMNTSHLSSHQLLHIGKAATSSNINQGLLSLSIE